MLPTLRTQAPTNWNIAQSVWQNAQQKETGIIGHILSDITQPRGKAGQS